MRLIMLLWKKNVNLSMKVTRSYQSKDSKNGKAWQEVIAVKLIHVNGPNFYL